MDVNTTINHLTCVPMGEYIKTYNFTDIMTYNRSNKTIQTRDAYPSTNKYKLYTAVYYIGGTLL